MLSGLPSQRASVRRNDTRRGSPLQRSLTEMYMHRPSLEHHITAHRVASPSGILPARVIHPAKLSGLPPLVVLHGISRNADELGDLFTPESDRSGQIIVVPHFSEERWPHFQRPSRSTRPDQALLGLLSRLSIIDPALVGRFDLFGHSGGAQLAHRFAMLYPQKVARLSLAAAGWYCLPDTSMAYPYGLATNAAPDSKSWARRHEQALPSYLRLSVRVFVGTEDTERDESLRQNPAVDRIQGSTRIARAQTYVDRFRAAALERGITPDIALTRLPGVAHDVAHAIQQGELAARITTGARPLTQADHVHFRTDSMTQESFAPVADAKWTFSSRRVDRACVAGMDSDFVAARAGDLILAQVESLGQHQRVQLSSGRPSAIYPGDMLVLACGARYAPDQFEGLAEIDPAGADLLAGGGCIGRMVARNERIKNATRLLPVGRLLDRAGRPLNLNQFALPPLGRVDDIPAIFVLGTAMNSGKTLATAQLTLGLRRAGYKVAALKGTGTGAFGDFNEYTDSGAHWVADFTDAGMVSTYQEPLDRVKDGLNLLLAHATERGCQIAVVEIADGLFQPETGALIADPWFRNRLSSLIFACGGAVAAAGGVAELARHGLRPDVLTGLLSASPMATAEAERATGVPVLRKSDLSDPAEANVFALRAFAAERQAM